MACQEWGFLLGFQHCLAFSVCFSQGDVLRARPVPLEVKWSTGVFTVLHSPQEPPREKQKNQYFRTIIDEIENAIRIDPPIVSVSSF